MQLIPYSLGPAAACLALLVYLPLVCADFWTVTSYFEVQTTTSQYGTYTFQQDYDTYTITRTAKSGVSPTASPISVDTSTEIYEPVVIVEVYLPAGAVAETDIQTTQPPFSTNNEITVYMESVVYTAPASCPTHFTVSTIVQVDIPTEVTDQVTPTSRTTVIYDSTYTVVTAFLSLNAAPAALPLNDVYSDFVALCRNPTATGSAFWGPYGPPPGVSSGGSTSSGGSANNLEVCALLTGCTSLRTWVIVVATLLPSLFVLGWLESFIWFRRLMLGKMALRFGTVCWIVISLWVLCFTRTSPARSAGDQAALRTQWNGMSAGTRWKLWWKWGFRHAYPIELLGPDPKFPNSAQAGAGIHHMQSQGVPMQQVPEQPPVKTLG
jgi:hypothetical protein